MTILTARCGLERPLAHDGGEQVGAVDEAHGDVELAVDLPRLVDRDHVRVVDRGGEHRLALEALAELAVAREVVGDQLQRDGPRERDLGRAVDAGPCRPRRRRRRSGSPRRRCPPSSSAIRLLYRRAPHGGGFLVEVRDCVAVLRGRTPIVRGLEASWGGGRNETRALARDRRRACRGSTGGGIAGRARLGHHARRRHEDERPRQRAVPPRRLRARSRSASTRAGATRRWRASAPRSPTRRRACSTGLDRPRRATPPCAACSPRTGCRSCASRWAPRTSSTGDHYTYDDLPAGQTDYGMRRFSIAHDRKEILPLLRQALALNPKIKVIGVAVEPAGVDEDQPVADRRAADRRAADLRRLRALLRQVRAGLQARGRPDPRAHGPERAAEPQAGRLPRHGHAGRPAGQADRGARADAAARAGCARRSSATTTTGRCTKTTSPRRRPARSRRPSTRRTCWRAAPRAGSPAPRSTATPATRAARPSSSDALPRQGHLVHRVLGLARPDRPAGAVLLRHAQVAHAQPRARRHPQLGQDGRELEPRARPRRRPAQRRLRHLHRRRHRRARRRP